MISRVSATTLYGIDPIKVDVEVDISVGLPSFSIVGLPETSVKESKERVRAAIKNAGFDRISNLTCMGNKGRAGESDAGQLGERMTGSCAL